jgi:hypothetical protein
VALIVFTPLKYYIPGYDDLKIGREYKEMKYKVDDMAKKINNLEQYNAALRKALESQTTVVLDTSKLQLPKYEISND